MIMMMTHCILSQHIFVGRLVLSPGHSLKNFTESKREDPYPIERDSPSSVDKHSMLNVREKMLVHKSSLPTT